MTTTNRTRRHRDREAERREQRETKIAQRQKRRKSVLPSSRNPSGGDQIPWPNFGPGIIGALVLFISISTAQAAIFTNGNTLFEWCGADQKDVNYYQKQALCHGYIRGVVDAQSQYPTQLYCIPPGTIMRQLVDIVILHLKERPSKRHLDGEFLIYDALTEAYPCGQKK